MAEIPEEIKPIFDEFTTVEGEILAEVGVSINTIIEYAREWEQRCMPQFLGLFAAGVQAGREAAAADVNAMDADDIGILIHRVRAVAVARGERANG